MPRCSTEVRPAVICVWGGLATRERLQFKVYTCYILKVDYNISRFNVRSSDFYFFIYVFPSSLLLEPLILIPDPHRREPVQLLCSDEGLNIVSMLSLSLYRQ